MEREYLLRLLHAQVKVNGHIIGAAVGSGMTAKFAAMGGADLLLALSAGRYRVMGRSSYAGYLCYGSSNEIAMELGTRELLPIIKDVPVLFGLFASDPGINLYDYLKEIKAAGFSGVVNFPTLALIDGRFREALEEEGNSYEREAEAIRLARYLDLFTVAFVTTRGEAQLMLSAGADVICVHLGLTKGGFLGAKKYFSIEEAKRLTDRIFADCERQSPETLRMIYAGPASTPLDMEYIYRSTACQGYIGGSTFERIPTERAIYDTTRAFKSYGTLKESDPLYRLINGGLDTGDYAAFVKGYIEEHYMKEVRLGDLAVVAHVTPAYLGARFKKETGISFTEYLISCRMEKAKRLLEESRAPIKAVASAVGYVDHVQFEKIFKKRVGMTPGMYRKVVLKDKI